MTSAYDASQVRAAIRASREALAQLESAMGSDRSIDAEISAVDALSDVTTELATVLLAASGWLKEETSRRQVDGG